jgi:ribosomal protein S18 acetylase RimI-like enzyme
MTPVARNVDQLTVWIQMQGFETGTLSLPEISAAVALWEEAGLLRPWNDPVSDIRRALEAPSSTVIAGRFDGRLVATVMVGEDGHRGWIYYLAVAAAERRRGVGRAMLAAAEGWLRGRVPRLNLMVRDGNEEAAGFYEALGYRRAAVTVLQRDL